MERRFQPHLNASLDVVFGRHVNKVGILKVLITCVLKCDPRVSHVQMLIPRENLNSSFLGKGHNNMYYT